MAEKTPYQQLAELVGVGDSETVPAIFETLADENEARVLLAAAPPATVAELSQRTGLEESAIQEMIDPLFKKGLLFKSKKADGERYYRVRNWMQFHDSSAVMLDPPPKMLDLWKQWTKEEWAGVSRKLEERLPSPALRVLPVNVSIDFNTQILALDDVKDLIDRAKNVAVTRCSCRAIDGACGKPLEVCMQLDKAADYAIERGTGRKLSKSEAVDMLRLCEDEGLVHCVGNSSAVGHVICNCCSDCCINWTSIRDGLGKFVAPSRFRAAVVDDDCTGCELCVDRCYFDAMHMADDGGLAAVNEENCLGCGLCQVVCATDAIRMDEVRPRDFIPQSG
jgi:Pyruvate/2-oxoacid:ferredoxin oxidoreductase delta subunit/predicted transcriptional regulator